MKSLLNQMLMLWMVCAFMLFAAYKVLDAMADHQDWLQDRYAEQYEQLHQ